MKESKGKQGKGQQKKDIYTPAPKRERYGYCGYEIEPKGKRPTKSTEGTSGTSKTVKGKKFQYVETVDTQEMKNEVVRELKRNGYIPYYTRTRTSMGWVYHIYYKRGAY